MTREQQQAQDRRYADWFKVYVEEVFDRATHWGDTHSSAKDSKAEVED